MGLKAVAIGTGGGGGPGSVSFSAGTSSAALGSLVFADSPTVSFGLNGNTITASAVGGGGGITNVNISAGTTSQNLSNFVFSNSNGLAFGLNGSTITGSYTVPSIAGLLSAVNLSAGTTSNNLSAFVFSNSNGLAFGLNGSTVTGSYTVPTVTNSSMTVSDALTSGTLARLAFTNLNGVTLSLSTGAGGSHTIVGSHNALTSQSNQAASASNGSFTFQTLNFSNANNVTFGTSAGGIITASVSPGGGAGFTAGMSNIGNTAGTTGVVQSQLLIVGGPNITVSQSINGQSATLSISGNTPGAAAEANWHNLLGANTAGNTTASGSTIGLSGINLTLSGTNGSQINISAPATSSLVGLSGINVSTAGSTISLYPDIFSSYEHTFFNTTQSVGQSTSVAIAFWLQQPLAFNILRIPASMTTRSTTLSTSSASMGASNSIMSTWNAVLYSMGSGASSQSLQSIASGSNGWTMQQSISVAANGTQYSVTLGFSGQAKGAGTTRTTQYSISNTNYSMTTNQIATEFSNGRFIDIPITTTLKPGNYWLVFGVSTSAATQSARFSAGTNCGVFYSNHFGQGQSNLAFGVMGSTNMTSGPMGVGSFTTAGGGTTASIPISAISSSASHVEAYFQLVNV